MQGQGNPHRIDKIAQGKAGSHFLKGFSHTETVNRTYHKYFFAPQVHDTVFLNIHYAFALQSVFEAAAIDHGSLTGLGCQPLSIFDHIRFAGQIDVKVDPSHTKGIHFPIQFPYQVYGFIPVSVSTDSFNPKCLSHEVGFKGMIALGRTQADTYNPFQF